ncbi:unnamed protein product [Urochloa humidicola]
MGAAHEVDDPYKVSRITEFFLYKVDIDEQELACNSVACRHTKDFSEFNPDSAYLTGGLDEEIYANKDNFWEIGIWDLKTELLHGLCEVQSRNPCFNWSTPIWITPSLH